MIAYLNGILTYKTPASVVMETGGVGYDVAVSLNTFSQLPDEGKPYKMLVYHHITEAGQSLFGFADDLERELFKKLISVSGIGPSTARMALSSMEPRELQQAIAGEDLAKIKAVKGIGPKSAMRIILELKDKLVTDDGDEKINKGSGNTIKEEALSALVALGFSKNVAEKAIDKILKKDDAPQLVEAVIKQALREL